jgi:hypothetical protein
MAGQGGKDDFSTKRAAWYPTSHKIFTRKGRLSESQGKVYATTKGPVHNFQKHLKEQAEIHATSGGM